MSLLEKMFPADGFNADGSAFMPFVLRDGKLNAVLVAERTVIEAGLLYGMYLHLSFGLPQGSQPVVTADILLDTASEGFCRRLGFINPCCPRQAPLLRELVSQGGLYLTLVDLQVLTVGTIFLPLFPADSRSLSECLESCRTSSVDEGRFQNAVREISVPA